MKKEPNKDEWGLYVNGKTGKLYLAVPKKKEYSPEEIVRVVGGTIHFLNTIWGVFVSSLEKEGK